MPYLVDGNNVMAQRPGWHKDRSGARRKLLDQVARFAQTAKVSLSVVFDGAPEQFFADGARYQGVRVFYARPGSSADERIKEIVESSTERRTLIVVTSDRALADYVRRCGARVVRAGELRQRLDAQAEAGPSTATKERSGVPTAEVDQWMRYFGVTPEDDQEQ